MFARLTAKAILAAAAIALAFFGIGLLGMALAALLVQWLGVVGGYAVAGAVFLLPPLIWAIVIQASKPKKPAQPDPGASQITQALLAAVAKETPWIAIVGAGLVGAAQMFMSRFRKPR